MDFLNSPILGIIIPMILVYALLSILVSILLEWWNHMTKERSIVMKKAILEMLKDPLNLDYGHLFYSHPAITGIKALNNRPPEYVSASLFADVLIDIVVKQAERRRPIKITVDGNKKIFLPADEGLEENILQKFQKGLDLMNDSPLKDLLSSFAIKSSKFDKDLQKVIYDYDKLKGLIGGWFDDFMNVATAYYKRRQHNKQFILGFIVAISLNVDSIHLVKMLSCDGDLRNRLLKEADVLASNYQSLPDSLKKAPNTALVRLYVKDTTGGVNRALKDSSSTIVTNRLNLVKDSVSKLQLSRADTLYRVLDQMDLPIGWNKESAPLSWGKKDSNALKAVVEHAYHGKGNIEKYIVKRDEGQGKAKLFYFLGIIISGISLGFGSPFWFQILVKFVNIRKSAQKS